MHAVHAVQSLLSIILTLSLPCHRQWLSYETKLSFSMTFKDLLLIFTSFQAWKMKCLNSMTFHIFHDMYKPCHMEWKFQGGGGSKAKVPSVRKNPLPISLLSSITLWTLSLSLAITRGLKSMKLPSLKTADCWGISFLLWQYQQRLSRKILRNMYYVRYT